MNDHIASLIAQHPVVLFMKGDRDQPQCGFSSRTVDILDEYLEDYLTVDVLRDPALREAIKTFSKWPTIPQLYVDGSFVGGSDIVHEMVQSGELAQLLKREKLPLSPPEVTVSEAARAAFARFWEEEGDPVVRLTVGPDFEPLLDLDEQREGDIVLASPGLTMVLNRATARRANGVDIDFVESDGQMGFKVDNPNRPERPSVGQLAPKALKGWIDAGKPHLLVDVRTAEEEAKAKIASAVRLDDAFRARLAELDRDTTLVFQCHHGGRSQRAAEHALKMGFRDVHNLKGGIDAWSLEVDSRVPRY